jgi:hypothetical protein
MSKEHHMLSTLASPFKAPPSLIGSPRPVTGKYIALVPRTNHEAAVLGAELVEGSTLLIQPTILQASEIVSVCAAYISVALKAAPAERRAMIASKRSLVSFVKPRQARIPSDAELDLVAPERLRDALSRAEARSHGLVEWSATIERLNV